MDGQTVEQETAVDLYNIDDVGAASKHRIKL